MSRRFWTDAEVSKMEALFADGRSYESVARELGRSVSAIKNCVQTRGLRVRDLRPMSAAKAGKMLGYSDGEPIVRWVLTGKMRGRILGRGAHRTRVCVSEEAVWAFMERPEHWPLWEPSRIPDPILREWAEDLRTERLLTIAQVAERFSVERHTVVRWLTDKRLPSVGPTGLRRIPESALAGFEPPHQRDRRGEVHRKFSPEEDALIARMLFQGATYAAIARILSRPRESVRYRHRRMQRLDARKDAAA